MDWNRGGQSGIEYSTRRTSSRTRNAPERYGEAVPMDDYGHEHHYRAMAHTAHSRAHPSGGVHHSGNSHHSSSSSSSSSQRQNSQQQQQHSTIPQNPTLNSMLDRPSYATSHSSQSSHVMPQHNNHVTVSVTYPPANSGSSSVHRTVSTVSSNHLRSMPTNLHANYANHYNQSAYAIQGRAQYSNHISQVVRSSSSQKTTDFPMVSMNSYEVVEVIVPLTPYHKNQKNERHIPFTTLLPYRSSTYKYYIRFCKFDQKKTAQMDCLPKCFLLSLNGEALQIKTKYSGNPYEITRLINDKARDIVFRVELPDPMEQIAGFHYGIVAVKKVDLKYLINTLPSKLYDSVHTINRVKQLLKTDDDCGLVGGDKVNVSLRDPFSSARLVHPARSKHCTHVTCFDLKSFIDMNEASSKWRCPHCREYIVVTDLIVDGLITRILENAPPNANTAYIDIMGRYTYDVKREPVIPAATLTPVKRENNSPETVPVIPTKKAKVDVECITISDSDSDDDSPPPPPSPPRIVTRVTDRSRTPRFDLPLPSPLRDDSPSQLLAAVNDSTNSSTLSQNDESTEEEEQAESSESDDGFEIIFEKLPTPPPPPISRPARPRPQTTPTHAHNNNNAPLSRPRPIHATNSISSHNHNHTNPAHQASTSAYSSSQMNGSSSSTSYNSSSASSSNLAKPVAVHSQSQQPQQHNHHSSLSSYSSLTGSGSSQQYNNSINPHLPPPQKLVHSFVRTDQNCWKLRDNNPPPPAPPPPSASTQQQQRSSSQQSSSNSTPGYGIYEGLPSEINRPIFHPTYTNQPNIFQYNSNDTINRYRSTPPAAQTSSSSTSGGQYPNYSPSAFSNPNRTHNMQNNDPNL